MHNCVAVCLYKTWHKLSLESVSLFVQSFPERHRIASSENTLNAFGLFSLFFTSYFIFWAISTCIYRTETSVEGGERGAVEE